MNSKCDEMLLQHHLKALRLPVFLGEYRKWKRHIEKGPFGNFKRDPLRNWKWVILLG
jgi:hypothetical protein